MSEFAGVGVTAGQTLWRIDGNQLLKTSIDGKFYQGNSYILLSTTVSTILGSLKHAIHVWNGGDTYEYDWKTSISKANELEEVLQGTIVMYREVEDLESPLFTSYFKQLGIEYVQGPAPEGSTAFARNPNPTLLQVKGKHVARVRQVHLASNSLAHSHTYVLYTEKTVFLYSGKAVGQYEKARLAEVAASIRRERVSSEPSLVYIDDEPQNAVFWKHLGGYLDSAKIPLGTRQDSVESDDISPPQLYKIEVDGSSVSFSLVAGEGVRLSKEMLSSDASYLFHGGLQGLARSVVYVWVGSGAPDSLSNDAISHALDYLNEKAISPFSLRIEKIYENAESQNFVKDFAVWHFKTPDGSSMTPERRQSLTSTASVNPRRPSHLVFEDVLTNANLSISSVSEGGELKMYRVDNFKLAAVPDKKVGQFYSADCYVLLYKTIEDGKERSIIYQWIGAYCSSDDKAAAVAHAKEMDEGLGNVATHVKVVEGREPIHFRALFKGSMVVHRRGKVSGYKDKSNNWKSIIQSVALYQVHASAPLSTHATQVPLQASSLNSADCFTLVTEVNVYLWLGKGSSETERASAEEISNVMVSTHWMYVCLDLVAEGEEPDDFWEQLGGRQEYASDRDPVDYRTVYSAPRLFHTYTAGAALRVEEIENFDQSDLSEDAVMLLDTYSDVYVWVGKQSTEEAKPLALDYAARYITASSVNIDRSDDTTVVVLQSGIEPIIFTQHFKDWDASFSRNYVNPYQSNTDMQAQALKKAMEAPKRNRANTDELVPYEKLKAGFLDGIPPDRKEDYIDDATFEMLFRMKRDEFSKLARWRKDKMKKSAGLF